MGRFWLKDLGIELHNFIEYMFQWKCVHFQQYILAIKLYHKFHQKSTKNLPKIGQKFSQTFPYITYVNVNVKV